jgi:hypothetical protein
MRYTQTHHTHTQVAAGSWDLHPAVVSIGVVKGTVSLAVSYDSRWPYVQKISVFSVTAADTDTGTDTLRSARQSFGSQGLTRASGSQSVGPQSVGPQSVLGVTGIHFGSDAPGTTVAIRVGGSACDRCICVYLSKNFRLFCNRRV